MSMTKEQALQSMEDLYAEWNHVTNGDVLRHIDVCREAGATLDEMDQAFERGARRRLVTLTEKRGNLKGKAYSLLYQPESKREDFDRLADEIFSLGDEIINIRKHLGEPEMNWHITTDSGHCTCGGEHHESNESDSGRAPDVLRDVR